MTKTTVEQIVVAGWRRGLAYPVGFVVLTPSLNG
jgi:hypothetical protein